jgi:hypothetical protein
MGKVAMSSGAPRTTAPRASGRAGRLTFLHRDRAENFTLLHTSDGDASGG